MDRLFSNERTARTFALFFDEASAELLHELLRSLDSCLDRVMPAGLSQRLDREGARLMRGPGGELRVEPSPALREALVELAGLDLFRLSLAATDGGLGLPLGLFYLAVQRIARRDAALALTALVQANVIYALSRHGTAPQRRAYLPRLAAGALLGTVAYTEPLAGSDAGGIRTRAVELPDGRGFRLHGSKCWITHGGDADLLLTSARTGGPGIKGVSTFLVERERDGVQVLGLEEKTGLAGSPTAALDYPELVVPADRMLGPRDGGGAVMFSGIGITRVGIGALALGIGKRAFEAAAEFAEERQQGGCAIVEHAAVQQRLARMALQLGAMEGLIGRAALLESRGEWHVREMSVTKLYCSEAVQEITQRAIGVHGGYGCSRDYAVERCRREAVALPLFGGTSEIQWTIISRELLSCVRGEGRADYRSRDAADLEDLRARCDADLLPIWQGLASSTERLWAAAERVAALATPEPFAHLLAEAATASSAERALLLLATGPAAGRLELEVAREAAGELERVVSEHCVRIEAGDSGARLRSALRAALG